MPPSSRASRTMRACSASSRTGGRRAAPSRRRPPAAGKSRVKPLPLARTKLLAPVRWPSAIYCAGANYADHAAEMARRMNRPMEPDPHTQGLKAWHFIKASRALADPGATVKISDVSDQVDWEVELVAVIGRAAKNVPEDKALDYVAGYTAANDLSARDRGRRAEHQRHLAVQGRLDQAQDLRRLVPARPLDRAGERHRRPAEPRPQAVGQRRPQAGLQQQGHDLQPGRADRAIVERNDAPSRRPRPHGNAGRGRRRRAGSSSSPAMWSRSGSKRSGR